MENLLKPDLGLMVWTVVTFLLMVIILKKVAWGPLLKTLEDREAQIKNEVESARAHREAMERMKADYEKQMSEIESRARALLAEAEHKGNQTREAILKDAESQAKQLTEKTRQQLEADKERLVGELRNEVGALSIRITERLLQQNLDPKSQEKHIQEFMKNLETSRLG